MIERNLLTEEWHVVGDPWLPPGASPYIISGHHDPHVGQAVVDMFEIEDDETEAVYDPWAIAEHVVELHNSSLRADRRISEESLDKVRALVRADDEEIIDEPRTADYVRALNVARDLLAEIEKG